MKNRNVKVIDEHNIDRNANVMFALDLEGSEYVVYWIERDEESNNVFVSKVLKNLDGTYNMLNIDDDNKRKEIAESIKILISMAVSDQNDKLSGTTTTLSNGKNIKFVDVSFNKEQNINVSKTYITTVKKEVTKVAETYYDVVVEETKVADVLPAVTPVVTPVFDVFPELTVPSPEPVIAPVQEPVQVETPVVAPTPVAPTLVEAVPVATPEVAPIHVVETPQVVQPVVPEVVVTPAAQPVLEPNPVVEVPVAAPVVAPVQQPVQVEASVVAPTPVEAVPVATPEVVPTPVDVGGTPLVFNATKETNLNAALGEVASSATIPVENIQPIREFGVETPVTQPASVATPIVPTPQPAAQSVPNDTTAKAGFASGKFFMVVAIAFFVASCIFLGYEVFHYFQLTK